ncbi:MAG: leucyl aminopeptidase [Actinomycetes bacterium]|jgi:leucyl aminopeptidase
MVKVKLTTTIDSDVLVVGLGTVNKKLQIQSGAAQVDSNALLLSLNAMAATGKVDEVIKLPGKTTKLIVFTGIGKIESTFNPEVLRRAAGAAARALAGNKSATFALPHKSVVEIAAIAEGAALGSYSFTQFLGSSKDEQRDPLATVNIITKFADTDAAKAAAKRAEIIAGQTFLVRDLINTPPSHLTPDSFCLRMKKEAAKYGVKVEIINDAALKKGGYGGIIGVGQGSANPPRLLHVTYAPAKAKKRFAFVGKGITFDTGGLALKPAAGMEAMKADMSGAAAVIAAVFAIAQLKLPIAIDGWAPLAENMVSDTATRPSDVITIYGGKTVEVLNPDAEGRLVLADALIKAAEVGKKAGGLDGIIDVATLTGAQVVALGSRTSAVMTNNDVFSNQFLQAAALAGEAFWPMPLPVELRASLDSPIADLANIGDRMGGMLVAGLFLKEFIDPQTPWLHLDIAGPAYNEKTAHGYTPVGGTGIALRSLICLAELASSQS